MEKSRNERLVKSKHIFLFMIHISSRCYDITLFTNPIHNFYLVRAHGNGLKNWSDVGRGREKEIR